MKKECSVKLCRTRRSLLASLAVSVCIAATATMAFGFNAPKVPKPPAPPAPPPLPGGLPKPPLPPPPVVPALPPPPPKICRSGCDVAKQDRVLIFLNNVATRGAKDFKVVYRFLEGSGKAVTYTELAPHYKKIYELSGGSATASNFRSTLAGLEGDPSVKAIDLLISLHGSPGSIWFEEGEVQMGALAKDILKNRQNACIKNGSRNEQCEKTRMRKLRIVYSAACYGATHVPGWYEAGFAAAAGAKGIHTDSAASFPTFLNTWRSGYSFADAVNRANSADNKHLYDNWAKAKWSDANSTRVMPSRPGVDPNKVMIWSTTQQDYHR